MKPRVYVETSVISYLAAMPSRDVVTLAHQQLTFEWWSESGRFDLYVSDAVLAEAARGDPAAAARRVAVLQDLPVLEVTREVSELAGRFLNAGVLPAAALVDAVHVAAAVVHGMDYLLTWNCAHIANAAVRASLERACREYGFEPPIICTPEELTEG